MNPHEVSKYVFTLLFYTAVLFFGGVCAQPESSLHISVFDQNAGVITGGLVKINTVEGQAIAETPIDQTGSAAFRSLISGDYVVAIESTGFEPVTKTIHLKSGQNKITVELRVKEIKVEVKVEREKEERRTDEGFTETYTKKQIAGLPDDIEAELKRKYGEDLLIQVDGFTGGQLPSKDQIASVRIIKNTFDAEFHKVGRTIVRITTKAGLGRWIGTGSFSFNDFRLNARNAFASKRLPKQDRSFYSFIGGPLVKNRTSLDMFVSGNFNSETENIIAILPGRPVENDLTTNFLFLTSKIGIKHKLSDSINLKFSYELSKTESTNIGIGEFSLPENGYSNKSRSHRFRFADDRILANRFANAFRAEFLFSSEASESNSSDREIIVSEAFNSGGAGIDNDNRSRTLTITDNLIFDWKKHALKIGGYFLFEKYNGFSADGTNGTFIFTTLNNFRVGRPSIFRQRQGTSEAEVNQTQFALYFQDDIRFYKNFQIGLGLRYEHQDNLRDSNNFSPRVSFTYSPLKNGKVVFRGGAGVFYEWSKLRDLAEIVANDGRQASELIVRLPGFPNPFDSRFVTSFLPPGVLRQDPKIRNPYVFVSQAAFNYRAFRKLVLEGFYTYRRGLHQFRSRDVNAPIAGIRPNDSFGRIAQVESSGSLKRHTFELRAQGTLARGTRFSARYTLSKATDDYDGTFGLPVNNFDLTAEKGPSNLDQRHFITGNFIFQFFNRFQIVPTYRIGSPTPYTITTGRDDNRDNVFNDRPFGIGRNTERGKWTRQFDLSFGWDLSKEIRGSNNKVFGFLNSVGLNVTVQNILNQTNLQNFVGNQSSPFFRQPTSAGPARTIQFGLRFMFL